MHVFLAAVHRAQTEGPSCRTSRDAATPRRRDDTGHVRVTVTLTDWGAARPATGFVSRQKIRDRCDPIPGRAPRVGCAGLIWRGEVYHVDLGQPVGHEPTFRRPSIAVSVDILNNGAGGLVVVVPVTTAGYGLRSHVELEPEGSGLDQG